MSSPQTKGGIDIFVGLVSGGGSRAATVNYTPTFLGWGTQPPDIKVQAKYSPLLLDVGGDVPVDDIYQGREAVTMIELGWWEESVLRRLEKFLDRGAGNNPGIDLELAEDRGSIMNVEGFSFPIWYRYRRRAAPAMVAANMRAGRRFYYTRTLEIGDTGGVKQNTRPISFHHRAGWNQVNGQFILGDNDMSLVSNTAVT